jgi:CRISPR-associated protein Csb2
VPAREPERRHPRSRRGGCAPADCRPPWTKSRQPARWRRALPQRCFFPSPNGRSPRWLSAFSARSHPRPKAEAGQALALATSKVWQSLTPFVPTRHLKTRKNGQPKLDENGLPIGSPEHDLRRLLRAEGYPEPEKIEPLPHLALDGGKRLRWLEFQRTRKHGEGAKAGERGYGFRITFPTEAPGPLALGYGAHFGLGLFVPER